MAESKRLVQCGVCVGTGKRRGEPGSAEGATVPCGRCRGKGSLLVPLAEARDAVQVTPLIVRDREQHDAVVVALAKLEEALGGTSPSVRDAVRVELLARGIVGVEDA